MHRSRGTLAAAAGVILSLGLLGACSSTSPSPKRTDLTLEECDPAGYVACNQQAAYLSIPIVDTGLSLTYSSQWAPGRSDRPDWNAGSLGLGGWSVNVIQGYDAENGILVGGDGSWRFANATPAGGGDSAVPSFDGSLAYVFNAAGRQVRTVDGHLGTVLLRLSYDAAGRLSRIAGTLSGQAVSLEVKRSAKGAPLALVGIDGAMTSLALDATGHLVGIQDPGDAVTEFAWAQGGLLTSETDALGGVSRYTYNAAGLLASESDPDGVSQLLSRTTTATSVEVRVTTTLGRVSTYRAQQVDGGIKRTDTATDGTTTTETTARNGSLTVVLPDGTNSRIGAEPSAIWGMAAPIPAPNVETRPGGVTSRTEIVQHLAEQGGSPYTLSGTVTTTVNGQRSVETFDPATRTTTRVDSTGRKTIDTYDASGRLVAESAPETAAVTYAYDVQGRETSETIGSGSLAQTTRYAYNASAGSITTTRPGGSAERLALDADGNVTASTGPGGSTVVDAYDADDNLTQVQPPGGLSFTLGSSPAGRPTALLPPQTGDTSAIETASYDPDGNLASISGLGTQPVTFAYNAAGQNTVVTFDQGKATASYNASSGLLSGATDPDGVSTAFAFDGDLPSQLTWSGAVSGSVSVNYDANNRDIAEATDGGPAMTLAYDGAGNLIGVGQLALTRDHVSGLVTGTTLGAVQTVEQYNANDWLMRATTTVQGRVVLDLQYTRDALGRITSVVDTGPTGSTTTTGHEYNSGDELAQVTVDGRVVETDTYDAAGNRTSVASPAGTTTATYNARDQLVTWGTSSYSWAPDGNLTETTGATGSTSYTFDDFGRLRGVTLANGESVTYLVDADGERVGREVDGRLVAGYLYDAAGNVIAETDGGGAVVARFGYDELGHLALVQRGGTTYRVLTDPVGSPLLVIDSQTGAVADAITYDAWGRIVTETAPGTIPFGFGGGLVDPDTGLVHIGARDYDPATGRWTSADPIGFSGGDPDLYRYADGDPVDNSDPTGLSTVTPEMCWPPSSCSPGDEGSGGEPGSSGAETFWPCGEKDIYNYCGWAPPSTCLTCLGPHGFECDTWFGCWGNVGPQGPIECYFGSCSATPEGDYACNAVVCIGPTNPCRVWCQYGDTHFLTGDGVHVDFQAAGEFTAITSPDGKIDVQVRQQPWGTFTEISFATAVAVDVDGDRVGVYAREPSFLLVNGVAVNAPDIAERLPDGGTLERHGGLVTIGWLDGSRLTVTEVGDTLNYNFSPGTGVGATLTGLLGSSISTPAPQLVDSDGTVLTLSDPDFSTKLYSQFANSWRITQAESLFHYWPGESTATFTLLNVPTATFTSSSLSASARAYAETVCRAVGVEAEPTLDDCILDVGATGDPAFAAGEAAVAAAGTPASASSTGTARLLTLGRAVSGTISSPSQHADYTFAASAGEIVYLEAHGACVTGLGWNLTAPDGSLQAFSVACRDIGREVLPTAGIWTVEVSSQGTATGAYGFTVLAVPAPTTMALSLGQPVSGSIGQIGQEDNYTFAASAGEIVYLKAQGACVTGLGWSLFGPGDSLQGFNVACGDIGRQVLPTSGIWTVQVGSQGTATGGYEFTVSSSH